MKKKLLSIIVSNYNEAENIEDLYRRVKNVFNHLPTHDYELLYVDNDSNDNSENLYNKLSHKDKKVKVIYMSRNFGSPQPSFLAGLEYASGDACVLLHGDIQDPPELIPQFIKKWELGFDVVYGIRQKRKGYGLIWNFMYTSFYYILSKLSYFPIPRDAGDFSLIDGKVVKVLISLREYDYYLRCLRAFAGFNQTGIEYVRDSRKKGNTTSSFLSGFDSAKTMIVNFSFKPLSWISLIAFFGVIVTLLFGLYDLVQFVLYQNAPPGIATVLLVTLFLGSVQLLSLSVIAEYLSRIFLEVKRRPRYIIRKTINIKHRLLLDK